MIKRVYLFAAGLGLVIGSVLSYKSYQRMQDDLYPVKPNILVLSLCSLRKAELEQYDPSLPKFAPNISRTFDSSFVLDNVYSSFGWTNLSLYFLDQFDGGFLPSNGYDVIEDDWHPGTVRVAGLPDPEEFKGPPAQFVNVIEPKLEFVKKRILQYRKRPFFAFIHIKYMHFPYIDTLNPGTRWDRYLTPAEKSRVENLLNEPARLREHLPFAMAMTGDMRLFDAVPEFRTSELDPFKKFFGMYNLLLDKGFLDIWKAQPSFRDDLNLLKKVYRAKLTHLDEMLKDILNLYGRDDIRDDTLIVLMGDHGEAMMEHGILGHGQNVYDEILTLPVMVRYPRSKLGEIRHIRDQIHMGSLVDWLKTLVTEGQRESDFEPSLLGNSRNRYVVSRNCSNNIHSVRFENRWKFIHDRVKREKLLFDLKADPGETANVAADHPDVAADLEVYLATHLKDLKQIEDPTPCKH